MAPSVVYFQQVSMTQEIYHHSRLILAPANYNVRVVASNRLTAIRNNVSEKGSDEVTGLRWLKEYYNQYVVVCKSYAQLILLLVFYNYASFTFSFFNFWKVEKLFWTPTNQQLVLVWFDVYNWTGLVCLEFSIN